MQKTKCKMSWDKVFLRLSHIILTNFHKNYKVQLLKVDGEGNLEFYNFWIKWFSNTVIWCSTSLKILEFLKWICILFLKCVFFSFFFGFAFFFFFSNSYFNLNCIRKNSCSSSHVLLDTMVWTFNSSLIIF